MPTTAAVAATPDAAAAPWLATMRQLAGVKEYPGGDNNPTILGWASFIAGAYPEMAAYCALYKSDDISWCGLTVAYTLAKNGIRPPFGATDTDRFLWANSFPAWGLRLDAPQPGAIVVFKWKSGGGHVGVVDHISGTTIFSAGGNQSDAVNVTPFAWDSQVVGFFWPPAMAAQPSAVRTPDDVKTAMGKAIVGFEARRDAQGHLAVYALPANDGGGTYEVAGINDRYNPNEAAKLKAMIAAGQYDAAEAFADQFIVSYTDVADGWTSSYGVEFYLRDSVFNRGPTGAAKILQRALILRGESLAPDGVDGSVGPITMAAIGRQETDADSMLAALRQAREDYEREVVGYRANLWNGLVNRWNHALTTAKQFQSEQPKESAPVTDPTTPAPATPTISADQVVAQIAALRGDIANLASLLGVIVSAIKGALPSTVPIAQPEPPAPTAPTTVVPAPAAPSTTPVLQQPGVGLGILGGVATALLQAFGVVGPMTGDTATTAGQALPIISAGVAALGATGTWGTVLNALFTVGAKLFQPAAKS